MRPEATLAKVLIALAICCGVQPTWANSIIVSLDGGDDHTGGVSEFDLNGNHLRDFNFLPTFYGHNPRWQDVEIGPDDQVYVASRRFNAVYRVDYATGDYETLNAVGQGKPGGFLSGPNYMQFRPNGNLLVSNEGFGHGVQEMENAVGSNWNSSLFSIADTNRRGVALGPDGKYYVSVLGGTIERYNSDGTHDAAYSISGLANFTGDIEFVGDDLLVSQQASTTIRRFDRETGAPGTDIPAGGSNLFFANDLLLLPDGRLLVGNAGPSPDNVAEVLEFDSATGDYLGVFASFPAGLPRGLALVPEPSTLVLIGIGLLGFLARRAR